MGLVLIATLCPLRGGGVGGTRSSSMLTLHWFNFSCFTSQQCTHWGQNPEWVWLSNDRNNKHTWYAGQIKPQADWKAPIYIFFLTFHSKIVLKAYFQEEELENARNLIHSVIGKASSRKFRKIVKSVSKPPKVPYLSSSCHEAQKKQDLG